MGPHPTTMLEGVVVRLVNFGDAHRIVELVSAQLGRVSLIARGARGSRKRFAGILDLFVTLRVQAQPKSGLWTLSSADAMQPRLGIRASLQAVDIASGLCGVARALAPEQQPVPELYSALEQGLDACATARFSDACTFFPRMAAAAGILPLASCHLCGTRAGKLALHAKTGAWSCLRCTPSLSAVSAEAVAAMGLAPIASLGVGLEVERCIVTLVGWHTGKPLLRQPLLTNGVQ